MMRRCALALAMMLTAATVATSAAASSRQTSDGMSRRDLSPRHRCDVVLPHSLDTIDGDDPGNIGPIKPGAILCLAGGTRSNLRLKNLHGAPGRPIVVRNVGGSVVTITGTLFEAGITIQTSSYLRVTGGGLKATCGSQFTAASQHCGMHIDGTNKGIRVNTSRGAVNHLEIDHLSITNLTHKSTRGIAVHPLIGQVITGVAIHHMFISNTGAEGIYVGAEPRDVALRKVGRVDEVSIHHNYIRGTGFDGIKVKVAMNGLAIHDNLVVASGQRHDPAHQGAIKMAYVAGNIFSNVVVDAVEGIRMGRRLDTAHNRYYDNVVIGTQKVALDAPERNAFLYGNVVVNAAGIGIRAPGDGTRLTANAVLVSARPYAPRSLAVGDGLGPDDVLRLGMVVSRNMAGIWTTFGLVPPGPALPRGAAPPDLPI
ncbi:MAG TPA: hypothetical protein VF153_04135 [Candidatus Limnocylindria bacterium]